MGYKKVVCGSCKKNYGIRPTMVKDKMVRCPYCGRIKRYTN